ncbi:non-specific lipid-transfer protein 1-like [Miscanthus floridulus]|uniref:non-specific lipid-transfer protein 1-like n=1 Tax=Miscanthus floridulus TaxID=154761 RepID=UPI00345933F5
MHEAMMAATRWSLVVGAAVAVAVAVAVALSSPCFTTTAAARPLPYAGRSSPASLDCATVTSLLAGCKAFVRRGAVASASPSVPAPGAACCEGVAELYAVASDSADNWRSVCRCMAGLVRRYPSNASAIALLPVLCAVLPPAGRAAGDTLTYCTSPS